MKRYYAVSAIVVRIDTAYNNNKKDVLIKLFFGLYGCILLLWLSLSWKAWGRVIVTIYLLFTLYACGILYGTEELQDDTKILAFSTLKHAKML